MAPAHKNRNYRRQPTINLEAHDGNDGIPLPRHSSSSGALSLSPFPSSPELVRDSVALPLAGGEDGEGSLGDRATSSQFCSSSLSVEGTLLMPRGRRKERAGDGEGEDYGDAAAPQIFAAANAEALHSCSLSTSRAESQKEAASSRIASGVGYNMLRSMGWRENTGLGQSSNGIVDPILPTTKPNHLGIGFSQAAAYNMAQKQIGEIQKAKREERDRKHQLKLEQAQLAEEEQRFMRESFIAELSCTPCQHPPESDAPQGMSSDAHNHKPPAGLKTMDPGQCPHCRQKFETRHSLKSHINARHGKQLLAAKRQLKEKRHHGHWRGVGGTSSHPGKKGSAHHLAPMSQDFSIYD